MFHVNFITSTYFLDRHLGDHDHQRPQVPEAACLQAIRTAHGPSRWTERGRVGRSCEYSESHVYAETDKASSMNLNYGFSCHSDRTFELAVEPREIMHGGDDLEDHNEQLQRLRDE